MNTENLLIESDTILQAQEICNFITEPDIRNRAIANIVGVKTVLNYFSICDVDITTGLHNISEILKKWEISDIYVNGAYIDVRLHFNENDICVPKYHFDNNLLPKVYMFIKVNETITNATVTGFISPELIDITTNHNGYYQVKISELQEYPEICDLLEKDEPEFVENLEMFLYDYIDDIESNHERISKHLLSSPDLRVRLAEIVNAKNTFEHISIDSVLTDEIETENVANILTENLTDTVILEEEIPNSLLLDTDSAEEISLGDYGTDNSLTLEENTSAEYLEVFSTEVTPSINTIESMIAENIEQDVDLNSDQTIDTNDESMYNIEQNNDENEPFSDLMITEEKAEEANQVIDLYEHDLDDSNIVTTSNIEDIYTDEESTTNDELDLLDNISDIKERDDDIVLNQDISNLANVETIDEDDLSDVTDFKNNINEASSNQEENAEIDELFNNEQQLESNDYTDNLEIEHSKTKSNKIIPLLGALVIVGAIGYYGFTKYSTTTPNSSLVNKSVVNTTNSTTKNNDKLAMPDESIENSVNIEQEELGESISLPQIEENLDASIIVSNLYINWEVPVSYVANATAKRFLTKVGKIIQMNLKTDLLLINKPPITNKITLGLEFNKSTQKFKVKDIILSSGEEQFDEMIKKTVNRILNNNFNFNMNVFNDLPGNPSLIIHL